MTEIAELAVGLAEGLALPVFPCRADKRPACFSPLPGCGGLKMAGTEPAAIRALWRRFPGPLIGVPTGAASGLFVLDIDPDGIDWLGQVCAAGRLAPTRTHRTRRGGFHLIYRLPKKPLPNSASKLAHGVDTRGEGGYVIWPPSPGYTLANAAPIAALPRWLENRLRAPRKPDPSRAPSPGRPSPRPSPRERGEGDRAAALIRFVAQSREGERNQRLFWAACRADEAGDRGLAARLVAAARQCGLDEIEARRTIDSAFRRASQGRAA